MRIVLATQDEPFYLPTFFDRFLKLTSAEVVGAVIGQPFNGTRSWFGVIKAHWRWYGTQIFIAQSCRFATRKALAIVDRQCVFQYSVRTAMRRAMVPIWSVRGVNEAAFVERVRNEDVGAIVSVAYPEIVRMSTLEEFPHGGINLHLGPLPRYRGLNPLFWCLLNGEPQSAVTIHRMVKTLDGGPILAQEFFPLEDVTSLDIAYQRAIAIGPSLLDRVLCEIETGAARDQPNPPEFATYFGFPTAKDGRAFRRAGKRFW
jgi:methionyl-tRNA formyltransferase